MLTKENMADAYNETLIIIPNTGFHFPINGDVTVEPDKWQEAIDVFLDIHRENEQIIFSAMWLMRAIISGHSVGDDISAIPQANQSFFVRFAETLLGV